METEKRFQLKDRIRELYSDYGLSYTEINNAIRAEFGVNLHDDTIRYHAKRKYLREETKSIDVKNGTKRTLILNDLHIPFHREQVVIDIVMKHRHEIDTIIFGGDVVDCEGISSFPKEIRKPLISEMILAYKFLRRIDKLTPDVKKFFIWGNHEYRYVRELENRGNSLNPLHSSNILQEIVNGFTHHDRLSRIKTVFPPLSDNFTVIDKWYMKYEDMVIAHPHNFSRQKLKTAHQALEHFISRGWKFNAIFIGHTHKWGMSNDKGIWFGETGCLCLPMDYADKGNVNYTPQDYGYVLVTHVNGAIDINQSRLYKLQLEDGEEQWQEDVDQE